MAQQQQTLITEDTGSSIGVFTVVLKPLDTRVSIGNGQ